VLVRSFSALKRANELEMSATGVSYPIVLVCLLGQAIFPEVSHGFVMTKIECPHNPKFCETPTCYYNVSKERPQLYHLNIGCKLKKAVSQIQVSF
jgi:hypothetical protein